MKMVSAYSVIANGGLQVTPSLIDRTQDRTGRTVYRQDQRKCVDCNVSKWSEQDEPHLIDTRERILDPMTAYQTISMMEGVIERERHRAGLIWAALRQVRQGPRMTTEMQFVGFTPELVTGIYIGYDDPRSLGRAGSGSGLAAPVFNSFMNAALKDTPISGFHMPEGILNIGSDGTPA